MDSSRQRDPASPS